MIAYVGLGSNLGDRLAHLRAAASMLDVPPTRVIARSSIHESAPVDAPPPAYLNAVVAVETALAPESLLDRLLAIEAALGRVRSSPGAPRTIDLDLLLCGDTIVTSAHLALPHPRLGDRRFVLEPLVEIASDLRHPVTGERLRDRLASLAAQPVTRTELRW